MAGYADIFESRRTMFETAEWWSQKLITGPDGRYDLSKLGHEIRPTGSFCCEETNAPSEFAGQVGDLRHTSRTVALLTSDDIMGKIVRDDIVRYDGKFWRVHSVNLQREWKRSQYARGNKEGNKIITLRG